MIRKSTGYALGILALLLIALGLMKFMPGLNSPAVDQLPTSTESPTLMNLAGKTISAFYMSDDQGRILKAKLDSQGTWLIENPSGCQYDSDQLASNLSLIQTFKVLVSMETPPELTDVGLATPTYQLILTFNDGSTQELSIGSIVPTGSGYYVQVNKDPVVVVSKTSIDNLFGIVSTVCATPTPEPSATAEPTLTQTETIPELTVTPAP
jgi:hypothetical protein